MVPGNRAMNSLLKARGAAVGVYFVRRINTAFGMHNAVPGTLEGF